MPKLVSPQQRQALMATPDGQELLAKFDEIQVKLQTAYKSNAYKSGKRQVMDSHLQERNSVMEKISAEISRARVQATSSASTRIGDAMQTIGGGDAGQTQ